MKALPASLLITATCTRAQTFPQCNRPRIVYHRSFPEIFSYPSTGGYVYKTITAAELEWLGLKPKSQNVTSNSTAPIAVDQIDSSLDAEEEDAFALRLLQVGGRWWPSKRLHKRQPEHHLPYGHHYPPNLDLGHTYSGRILVLRTTAEPGHSYLNMPDVAPERPDDWSRLQICATMEERCQVMRDFGATEYDSIADCADLPDDLEEGIAKGEWYAELLRKMEDGDYVDQWLDSL